MSIKSYLFVISFYLVGTLCLYICLKRILSYFLKRKITEINKLILSICILLYLGGVAFATFAFYQF
jgi:hypothetical protein